MILILDASSDTKESYPKQEAFKSEGLEYNMDGLTGNSLNSHRLIAYAGQQGKDVQDRVVEQLFKAYFTEVYLLSHSSDARQVLAVIAACKERLSQSEKDCDIEHN